MVWGYQGYLWIVGYRVCGTYGVKGMLRSLGDVSDAFLLNLFPMIKVFI